MHRLWTFLIHFEVVFKHELVNLSDIISKNSYIISKLLLSMYYASQHIDSGPFLSINQLN